MAPCLAAARLRRLGCFHRRPPTMYWLQYNSAQALTQLLNLFYLSRHHRDPLRSFFEKDLLLLFLSPCFSRLLSNAEDYAASLKRLKQKWARVNKSDPASDDQEVSTQSEQLSSNIFEPVSLTLGPLRMQAQNLARIIRRRNFPAELGGNTNDALDELRVTLRGHSLGIIRNIL